jgi:hypothetical protein
MLLIYTEKSTVRLQYICKHIFKERLGIAYAITSHRESFEADNLVKINYSRSYIPNCFQIIPQGLLSQQTIQQQELSIKHTDDFVVLFSNHSGNLNFDIFAASFYLLSKYEEYLPHEKDSYGRYAYTNSAAYKNNFLHLPLVDIWIEHFKQKLLAFNNKLLFSKNSFSFLPTYDIDLAWNTANKSWIRKTAGLIKYPSIEKVLMLLGLKKDVFDSYGFLDAMHKLHNLKPIYFFLCAANFTDYDTNVDIKSVAFQKLIKQHAETYEVGVHPSWQSNGDESIILAEKAYVEKFAEKPVVQSRQHYIKMELPKTYQTLIAAGITTDYSMGYGSANGFRASSASPFYWFDLATNNVTTLRLQPFCFMDANCIFEQNQTLSQAYHELMQYYLVCKKYNLTLSTIFHNNILGTSYKVKGWQQLYNNFLQQIV